MEEPEGFKHYFSNTIRYGIITVAIYLLMVVGLQNIFDPYEFGWYHLSYLFIGIIASVFIFKTLFNLSKVLCFYLEDSLSRKGINEFTIKNILGLFSVVLCYSVLIPVISEIIEEIESSLEYYDISADFFTWGVNSVFILIGISYAIPLIRGFFGYVDSIGESLEKNKLDLEKSPKIEKATEVKDKIQGVYIPKPSKLQEPEKPPMMDAVQEKSDTIGSISKSSNNMQESEKPRMVNAVQEKSDTIDVSKSSTISEHEKPSKVQKPAKEKSDTSSKPKTSKRRRKNKG